MSKQPNAMVTSTSNDQLDLLDVSHFDQFNLFDGHGLSGDDMPSLHEREDDTSTIASVVTASTNITISRRMNNPPTITSIYEPKFLEIFTAYRQFAQSYEPNIDLVNLSTQHLMTLCLNNLLPFSNWARDSATSSYIRNTLYDHADMRPEVRNGLALIIVYTFSAAKASDELDNYNSQFSNMNSLNGSGKASNIDMFSVLMRSDTGMGIVNKTSLKIYNDPLEYLSFIKSCISGLIDAVAIPENERQNIPQSKKSRRGSRNKDEVEAYHYLKTALIAMFQHPESVKAAQMKIKQVVSFWNEKGNTIRNERFSALYNLNTPGNTPTQSARNSGNNHNIVISDSDSNRANSGSNSNSNVSLNYQYTGGTGSTTNSAANSAHNSGVGIGSFPGINTLQISRTSGRSSTNSLTVEHRYSNGSTAGHMPEGRDVRQLSNNSVGSQQYFNVYDDGNNGQETDNASTSSRSPYASANNSFYNSGGGNSGAYISVPRSNSRGDNSPLMYNNNGVPNMMINPNSNQRSGNPSNNSANFARASGMANISVPIPPGGNAGGAGGGMSYNSNYYGPNSPLATSQVIPNTIPSVPVPSIRYDRTGTAHWIASNTLLYDLDALHSSLLSQSSGTYYLVDESKLAAYLEEAQGGVRGESGSITAKDITLNSYMMSCGVNSLEKVLQKSGSLTTSWTSRDFSQFKTFVESWKQIQIQHQLVQLQQKQEPLPSRSRNASYETDSTAPSRSGSILGPMVDFSGMSGGSVTGKRPTRRRTTGEVSNTKELVAQAVQLEAEVIAAQHRGSISIHPDMFQYDPSTMPPPATVPSASKTTGLSSLFGSVTMEESPAASNTPTPPPPPPPADAYLPPLSPSVTRVPTGAMSLLAYWSSLSTSGGAGGSGFGHAASGDISVRSGRGVIVYERSMEVGLILRANPRLQLYEDAWCLYYPEDVQYTPPPPGQEAPEGDVSSSFAALLAHLLPQSHPLMSYIQTPQSSFQSPPTVMMNEESNRDSDNDLPGSGGSGSRRSRNNSSDLRKSLQMGGFGGQGSPLPQRYTVSYFSHKSDHQPYVVVDNNISTEAPQAPPSNKYRTLGTLESQYHVITSKFSEGSYFHDIIIR